MMPTFNRKLKAAYVNTNYTAPLASGAVVLRIGEENAALQLLMYTHLAKTAAYVTAFNPYSVTVSDADNLQANRLLENRIRSSGLNYWPCDGQDPEGNWPSEPGFLVLGADRRWLRKLGRQFRQHALLVCHSNGLPKLLWTQHS